MRIYVLIASVNPLRVYLYEDGLARFATQPYIQPTTNNLEKQYMHLTNYAINKKNPKFIFNNNASNMGIGHKRSLLCVYKQLQSKGVNIVDLNRKIKDLIIKTIITGLPMMSHQYKCSQPEDYTGNMCFHILGFDIMMKSNADPVLLQVNHTPSFTTDTPLDLKIKKALIKDTLKIMNVNLKKKTQQYNLSMQNNQARLLTGKRNILQGKQRQQLIQKHQKQRQEFQRDNLGGYQVIYPSKDQGRMTVYKSLIDHSNKEYFEQKGSIRMKMAQKQSKRLAREQYKQLKKTKMQEAQKKNDSLVKSKQSTQQTAQNLQNISKVYKKSTTPISQTKTLIEEKIKAFENKEAFLKIQEIENKKTLQYKNQYKNGSISRNKKQSKNNFQILVLDDQNPPKTSKAMKTDESKSPDKRNLTSIKNIAQKMSELPSIIDNSSELLQKSNLVRGSEYDRRRYIKGPSTEKALGTRSISGKSNSMIKSTSTAPPQKHELNSRPTLSSVMARKKFEQKLNGKKKTSIQNPTNELRQEGAKILYNGFQANYDPNVSIFQGNGEYVMPKIFCLNFQAQKPPNQNLKFLMYRNFQNQSK